MISLVLVLQMFWLTVFAVLPYGISRFSKNRLPPSSARRKLIYATLGGLAFEIMCSVDLQTFLGHTGSCI